MDLFSIYIIENHGHLRFIHVCLQDGLKSIMCDHQMSDCVIKPSHYQDSLSIFFTSHTQTLGVRLRLVSSLTVSSDGIVNLLIPLGLTIEYFLAITTYYYVCYVVVTTQSMVGNLSEPSLTMCEELKLLSHDLNWFNPPS